MAATSEERREVAARLRTAAKTKSNSADYLWRRLEIAVNGWRLGAVVDESYVFYNDVLSRLADLIDPTCEIDSIEPVEDELGQLEGWEFHLTCGHSFQRPWNEPPAYCPECGARVVSDDDQ